METTPIPGRECGDCALCCRLPAIPALAKPSGEWCQHCPSHQGCDAYMTRPQMCRDFFCLYMQNANLGEDWKPNTAHFMLAVKPSGGGTMISVIVDPDFPDAWRAAPYLPTLQAWSAEFQLIIDTGGHTRVLFPDHEKDFGQLPAGSVIEFVGLPTPAGLHRTAQLRSN